MRQRERSRSGAPPALGVLIVVALVALTLLLNALAFLGKWIERLDAISNFAPLLAAAGFLAALLAMIWRQPILAAVALLGAAAPPAWLVGSDALGALAVMRADGDAPVIKVMTVNIGNEPDQSALNALVRRELPDIIFLQEAHSADEYLAQVSVFYPTSIMSQPACSTRILTRFVIAESFASSSCEVASAHVQLPPELGGGTLLIASIHTSPDLCWLRSAAAMRCGDRSTTSSSAHAPVWAIVSEAAGSSSIIGGGFHATPWTWAMRRLDENGAFVRRTHALPTWPVPGPGRTNLGFLPFAMFPVDHVFATSDWRTVRVRRGPANVADHYPVIVELSRQRE